MIMEEIKTILSIGDTHGRGIALQIAKDNIHKVDKIVFIGDYVDSFDISPVIILHNLKEIIEFKKQYPDKVVLLLGNHDEILCCIYAIVKKDPCHRFTALGLKIPRKLTRCKYMLILLVNGM